jgi:hypothetical protein
MIGRLLVGFVAALLSVLLVHQVIVLLLKMYGLLPATAIAYNMAPFGGAPAIVTEQFKRIGFAGFPILFNTMFWGGVWGLVFGALYPNIPGGIAILKGLLFGVFIVIVSNWIGLPLLRGQPVFAGYFTDYNYMRLVPGAAIVVGFGTGMGLIYGLLKR